MWKKTIIGSEYCFRKKNIGTGTEKKAIEQAYKNSYIYLFDMAHDDSIVNKELSKNNF